MKNDKLTASADSLYMTETRETPELSRLIGYIRRRQQEMFSERRGRTHPDNLTIDVFICMVLIFSLRSCSVYVDFTCYFIAS